MKKINNILNIILLFLAGFMICIGWININNNNIALGILDIIVGIIDIFIAKDFIIYLFKKKD